MKNSAMFVNFFVLILIIVIAGFVVEHYFTKCQKYEIKYKQLENLKVEIDSCLNVYLEKDRRIENMSQTLMINYDLSKWEAKYYSIIFDDFANEYGIDWEIYAAMIRIESNFNPTIKSAKGAKGLTQVLEPTAKFLCDTLEIKYKESYTLWNDILNMVIGLTYLSHHIKEKDLDHGVRVYLGGPGYSKNKPGSNAYDYIGKYRTSVWQEFQRLQYIYRGVSLNNLEEK